MESWTLRQRISRELTLSIIPIHYEVSLNHVMTHKYEKFRLHTIVTERCQSHKWVIIIPWSYSPLRATAWQLTAGLQLVRRGETFLFFFLFLILFIIFIHFKCIFTLLHIVLTIISPFVLHGCQTWFFTWRDECRLRLFERRILRGNAYQPTAGLTLERRGELFFFFFLVFKHFFIRFKWLFYIFIYFLQ